MMFRFKALQKMRQPDELDSPSLLAAPRGWIAIFVIMFVMAGAAVWAFAGSIPVTVAAPGLLTYAEGTSHVFSPVDGTVTDLAVRPGDRVQVGQQLAAVEEPSGTVTSVDSPFSGQVIGLTVTQAQVIDRGAPLLTVERTSSPDEPLVAMLFVPEDSVQGVRAGLGVGLSVASAPAAQFGLLQGSVSSVSEFPLSSDQVSALVGGDLAARDYTPSSAPHLVIVSLRPDPATPSGFAWSTAAGSPRPLRSQIQVQASVEVGADAPIQLLFGR